MMLACNAATACRHCFGGLVARRLACPSPGSARLQLPAAGPEAGRDGTRAASSAAGGGLPPPPDVRELARMAQIEVTDEEVAEWGPQLESIVHWFGQLQEIPLEGVQPAVRADLEGQSSLRPDVVVRVSEQERAALLEQVPNREGAYVRVPKITTGADG